MKRNCFLLLIVLFFSYSQAQIVNIPDANFKTYLLNDPNINTNGDGEIQVSEAEAITALHVTCGGCVSSIEGIEFFINLEWLSLSFNPLISIDVSQNINLNTLICNHCLLSNLDVSQNILLDNLSLRNNEISNIDVTLNTLLSVFNINNNQLSSIDLTQNILLERTDLSSNQISILNVTQNTELISLEASNNVISDIDISYNDQLNYLYLSNNPITSIDLSQNINLQELWLESMLLTDIDFSNSPFIYLFTCSFSEFLNSINAKNNNNGIIEEFYSIECPNLQCIYVDDPNATYLSSWQKDDHTNFVNDQTECDALSIEEHAIQSVLIYPNPTHNIINIEANSSIAIIELYNLFGQLIFSVKPKDLRGSIDMSELNSGMYLIKVIAGEQTGTYTAIKR